MFLTAIVFMVGILSFYNDSSILCAGILTLFALIILIRNYMPLKFVVFLVLIFYTGFFNAYLRTDKSDSLVLFDNEKVDIKGQIVSVPNTVSEEKTRFFFKVYEVGEENASGKTLVTVSKNTNKSKNFQAGDYFEMKGRIKTPFKSGNPSQFDYGKYLKNFDTYTVFYTSEKDCKTLNKKLSLKWTFIKELNNLRDKIIDVHSKYLRSPNLEILGGIVFGDDAVAPPDYIKASFVNSGLLHILAASGMNVAFIYAFWVFFMRRAKAPFKLTVISGMILVVIYTMMTGLGASVIRAALMLLLVLLGKLIDRDSNNVALLALVAMLMLIYNPAFINDVGFQLSFVVTFGLLTTANVIFEKFPKNKVLNYILGILFIPVIAQIWVAPIQMFYFNTISTYSIFANILSVPFLSVVSFGGFISSILAIFTPITDKICFVLDFILNYALNVIVYISNFFANLSHSIYTTTHPSVFQIFIYYAIILLLTLSVKKGAYRKLFAACAALLIILCATTINIPSQNLDIITFDVQNADCFLIQTPKHKHFIIDTGRAGYNGGKSQANSIIIKYLKDKGIKTIDGLIITHFDSDHSGGAVDIMKNFNVRHVYINSFDDKSNTSYGIYKTLKEKSIPSEIPKGTIYSEPELSINTFIADKRTDNEKSIITLLSYKNFDMLFMGDAGIKAYDDIKSGLKNNNIEILKVGHHGAYNVVNKEMLDDMNTQVSVISTGTNPFGHPNRATLDILRNTDVYRTDRHNSIDIKTNGETYKIYLYSPDKHKYVLDKTLSAN